MSGITVSRDTVHATGARVLLIAGAAMLLAACGGVPHLPGLPGGGSGAPVVRDPAPFVSGTMRPYQVRGRWYRPEVPSRYDEVGMASWYGAQFNGRSTASGERFDMNALTAAHKTLPLPALVEVTNQATGRSVVVRVNDRGPFAEDRIIDLSREAADELGLLARGVGEVRVRYLGPAPRGGGTGGARLQQARAEQPVRPRRGDPEFWVQAGSFSDRVAARIQAESLGDDAEVRPAEVNGRRVFRVVVGPWDDANRAEQARQSIVARGVRDALLISGR